MRFQLLVLRRRRASNWQMRCPNPQPSILNPKLLYLNNTTRGSCDAAWGDPAPECFLCWKRLVRLAGQAAELQNETERDL